MMVSGSAVQIKGFGIVVGLAQEAVDGGLEVGNALEDAAFEPAPGQLGEEALDRVEPGGGGRSEVEMEAPMPPEPGADFGMLVGGVIVDDQMHLALGRGFAADFVEKADEFLMPVAAHALADDLAVEHVECGEQGCRAVAYSHGSSCRNGRASSAAP